MTVTPALTVAELNVLADLASEAAQAAGDFIASSRPSLVEHKPGASSLASQIVTDVDRAAERLILKHLATVAGPFDLGLLTEETPDDGSRFEKPWFWCIDPLDGTLAYSEGRAGYAVSIALVSQAGEALLGVVFDPVGQVLYRAVSDSEMSVVGLPATRPLSQRLRVFFDQSMADIDGYDRLLTALDDVATDLGLLGADVTLGATGAVLNACRVLDDPPGCYFKFPKAKTGGGSVWDFAATASLCDRAGATVTDMFGQPLQLNPRESTFMNRRGVLIASNFAIATCIRSRTEALFASL